MRGGFRPSKFQSSRHLPCAGREDVLGFRHGLLRGLAATSAAELRSFRVALQRAAARYGRDGWLSLDGWTRMVSEAGLLGSRLSHREARRRAAPPRRPPPPPPFCRQAPR